MTTNQNGAEVPKAPWGLGWGLRDSLVWTFFGELVSPATFGHVGATGTVAWADPVSDVTCVILTNAMVEEGALLKRISNVVAGACDVVDPPGVCGGGNPGMVLHRPAVSTPMHSSSTLAKTKQSVRAVAAERLQCCGVF